MKFTNVKQLIIKFMGGGLINFPTRFLRWVKINGDTDDSDDGGGDGGGSSDMTLGQAWIKAFRLDKQVAYNNENHHWDYTDDNIPLPDLAMALNGDTYILDNYFDRTKTIEDYNIVVPENVGYNETVYEYVPSASEYCKFVPLEEFDESDIIYNEYGNSGNVYFLYNINRLSDEFSGGKRSIKCAGYPDDYFRIQSNDYCFFVKYNDQIYFFNEYSGD